MLNNVCHVIFCSKTTRQSSEFEFELLELCVSRKDYNASDGSVHQQGAASSFKDP